MRKTIVTLIVAAGMLFATAGACDPGDSKGGGKPKKVVVYLKPGQTKITKSHYGMWKASDNASPNCRWVVETPRGQVEQSGGWKDRLIIGTAMRGHIVVISSNCVSFSK